MARRGRGRGGHHNSNDRTTPNNTAVTTGETTTSQQPNQNPATNNRKRGRDDDGADFFAIPDKKQKNGEKNGENGEKDDKKPVVKDMDVFLGKFEFLPELKHFLKVQEYALLRPNLAIQYPSDSSNFPQDALPDNFQCRNLIISLDPEHYKSTTSTPLFTEANDIKAKSKTEEIMNRMATELCAAKTFYKPKVVFVEIIDRVSNDVSDFNAILAYLCRKHRYQPLEIDPLNRTSIIDMEKDKDTRAKAYIKSLKWSLKTFHQPDTVNVEINKLPTNQAIKLYEM